MERHHFRHQKSRIDLHDGLRPVAMATTVERAIRRLRLLPNTTALVGLASFVTCGMIVVATASLIAIQIPN